MKLISITKLIVVVSFVRCNVTTDKGDIKIVLVVDSETQQNVIDHFNQSISYITQDLAELNVVNIDRTVNNESAYDKIHQAVTGDASFLIGSLIDQSRLNVVERAVRSSKIPAIFIDWSPWNYSTVSNNTWNTFDLEQYFLGSLVPGLKPCSCFHRECNGSYISFIPPTTSMLNVLHPFIQEMNIDVVNSVVLYDDLYMNRLGFDQITKKILSIVGISKHLPIQLNDSLVMDQFIDLMNQGVSSIFLVSKLGTASFYMEEVSSYFWDKYYRWSRRPEHDIDWMWNKAAFNRITWVVLTKDTRRAPCESCAAISYTTIVPVKLYDWSNPSVRNFNDFQRWRRDMADNEQFNTYAKHGIGHDVVDISFYFDIIGMVWKYVMKTNETRTRIQDKCNDTNFPTEVGPSIYKHVNLTDTYVGAFGAYFKYAPDRVVQNMKLRITRHEYDYVFRFAKQDPPFVEKTNTADGEWKYNGSCIDMIEKYAEQQKFDLEFFEAKDKVYGSINVQEEWSGIIRLIIAGDADFGLVPLTEIAKRKPSNLWNYVGLRHQDNVCALLCQRSDWY